MDGASRPTMTTARPGGRPCACRERRPRPRRRPRGSRRRSASPSSSRAVGRSAVTIRRDRGRWQRLARLAGRRRPRASPWRGPRCRSRELLDHGPSPHPRTPGRSTDGRLTSTLAAAPRAAASASSAATFRSLEALALLRPASASAAPTSSTGRPRHSRAGSRPPDGPRPRWPPGARDLRVRGLAAASARPKLRRRPRRRRRRGPGTGPRAASPDSIAHTSMSSWSAYLGRPVDSAATIRTRLAPRAAATAEALPPPGTGSATRAARRTRRGSDRANRPASSEGCTRRL